MACKNKNTSVMEPLGKRPRPGKQKTQGSMKSRVVPRRRGGWQPPPAINCCRREELVRHQVDVKQTCKRESQNESRLWLKLLTAHALLLHSCVPPSPWRWHQPSWLCCCGTAVWKAACSPRPQAAPCASGGAGAGA